MDSLTHIAIGAAAGEAVAGKKAGYRAAIWGAAFCTLPDLDILINPFVDDVGEIYYHRGFTHSFVFSFTVSPILGWLVSKFHSTLDVSWIRWSFVALTAIILHILIDLPTIYGTQIFQPFTNTPFAAGSMFIIDPLLTLPVSAGVITALFLKRTSAMRFRINLAGLILSGCYLLWGLGIKAHVHSVFQESFQQQSGQVDKIISTPNGPTTFLWNSYIVQGDTIYQGVYSIFDSSTDISFLRIPRNSHKIEPFQGDRAYEALIWFSRGYYTVHTDDQGDLIFYDLRFGRDDLWLTEDGGYVWANRLIISEDGNAETFEQFMPTLDVRARNLRIFWQRIWGK